MRNRAIVLSALGVVLTASSARGYDFEISARTIAQGYQLRWIRFSERDRLLNRNRLTQSLGVDIWDLLEPSYDPARPDPPPLAPFNLYFTSSLRVNHDFGDYADATLVPELGSESFDLELLYAYVGVRNVLGVVDAELGRQLLVDNLDWYAFDGLHVTGRLPIHLQLEGQVGWLVRDSSPLGTAAQEPDGSSSAECLVFVPGTSDFAPYPSCAQREQAAPTFGFALATHGLADVVARISYRRSVSQTVPGATAGTSDELPRWGVLQEKLSGEARGNFWRGAVVPWAAARWNLLAGLIDQAHAGVRIALGDHALTPELLYSYPTFDGDSIWNVFATEPYWDARLTWDAWPGRGPLRGYLRGYLRRFSNAAVAGESGADAVLSAGAGAGARWTSDAVAARLDLFYEDGYGGLRAGGDLSGRWRPARRLELEGRLSLIRFDEDSIPDLHATTFAAQLGGRWQLGPGMALHLLGEHNSNRFDESQLRIVAILDLAFAPEH
jgi:hypothetical protein